MGARKRIAAQARKEARKTQNSAMLRNVPENNSLKKEIEELLEWCEKKEKEEELGRTYFNEPVSDEKMTRWEEENGVKIPESYKEWLRFTEKCMID